MSSRHPASLPVEALLENCEIKKTRRGGPGGQHRNKVESAIVITHLPTGIVGQAGERRSQHENRRVAIERLRFNLALGIRRTIDLTVSPSMLWKSRVKGQKIAVSADHADFPALLAEAMDFLNASDFEIPPAAGSLGVSNSQLIRLLKTEPAAFAWLNQNREKKGSNRLK